MKDEQRVFIRGVKGRGSEVVKMLEDRGGISAGEHGDCPRNIYFITHSGSVDYCPEDDETAKIIMDNYKEIKLWRDGDILINNDGTDYKVFWEYDSDSDTSFYAYNVSMHVNGTLTQYSGSIWHGEKIVCFIEDYRLATPSEVERFHELLHKHSKDWDAEKKQVVDRKWKPRENDSYYFIDNDGDILDYVWEGDDYDTDLYNFGNCFRTHEEAEVMAEKIKELLKGGSM